MSGLIWDGTTQLLPASLNTPVVFDARVSAAASVTSGATFATVAAAIAAGKRSIYVEAGDYAAGFDTNGANNLLVYCGVPAGYDGGFQGATFGGQITVRSHYVKIVGAHVVGSSGYGIRVDLGYFGIRLEDCTVYQSTNAGYYLGYQGALTAGSFDCICRGCVANDCGGTLYDGFYIGDYDYNFEWLLDSCHSFSSGRDGFSVAANAVAAVNATVRLVTLQDCKAYVNGVHGLRVGPRASVAVMAGNYRENGSAGIYLSTQENAMARSQIMGARVRSNVGGGLQLGAVSSSQIAVGVLAYGNGTNFINAGSCLGYSTCNNGV